MSLDRPGYLDSEPGPDSTPVGVARDVVAVADALQLARFAVVGSSGGAGYALPVAHVAPERVTVVHLGGGIACWPVKGGERFRPARGAQVDAVAAYVAESMPEDLRDELSDFASGDAGDSRDPARRRDPGRDPARSCRPVRTGRSRREARLGAAAGEAHIFEGEGHFVFIRTETRSPRPSRDYASLPPTAG